MTRSLWAFLAVTAACAPATGRTAEAQQQDTMAYEVLPAGLGSLKQDDLTIRLRTDALEIRFLPLDQRVLKLLAPDANASLNRLIEGQQSTIDSVARMRGISRPGLALVSFFATQPNANFDADVLNLSVRNRLIRPAGIVPYTPGFAVQRLDVRQMASAIYLFEEPIPVLEPFTLQYSQELSNEWERKLSLIDRERQRVALRAQQQKSTPPR